jgi:hypothetical protein
MMAAETNQKLADLINKKFSVSITTADAKILRRAQLVLRRWHEGECGNSNNYASWAIERDPITQKPYKNYYPNAGENYRVPIKDFERGALKRIEQVCKKNGLNYFVQADPRGCALYVSISPINYTNYYPSSVACI